MLTSRSPVVLDDLDVVRIAVPPAEAAPPLIVDADAVLTGPVSPTILEVAAGLHPQMLQPFGGVENDQLPEHQAEMIGRKPADALTSEESFGVRIREAPFHDRA